jgi:hypothetical protein
MLLLISSFAALGGFLYGCAPSFLYGYMGPRAPCVASWVDECIHFSISTSDEVVGNWRSWFHPLTVEPGRPSFTLEKGPGISGNQRDTEQQRM